MKTLIRYLRADEWMSSKVTMMLGTAAYFLCINGRDMLTACRELAVYFLFLAMFLAISYVSNDFSDLEIDKKAGKKKVIAQLPRWVIWLSFVLMLVIGNVPILLYAENKALCAVLVTLTVFLGVAYSAPGLRFKERGVLGLIECSFAQHCMPLTVLLLFLDRSRETMLLWALWFILSFVDGLRYILIHQYIDQENDRATETHTFVADRQVNIRKYILGLYVVENICCVLLLLPLLREHAWVVALGVAFHVALEFCIYQVLNVYAKKDWMVSFDSVPLEAFLNMILPMMFGICLMKTSLWAGFFSLFILLCCYRALGIKLGIAMVYVRSKISPDDGKGRE